MTVAIANPSVHGIFPEPVELDLEVFEDRLLLILGVARLVQAVLDAFLAHLVPHGLLCSAVVAEVTLRVLARSDVLMHVVAAGSHNLLLPARHAAPAVLETKRAEVAAAPGVCARRRA